MKRCCWKRYRKETDDFTEVEKCIVSISPIWGDHINILLLSPFVHLNNLMWFVPVSRTKGR